MDVVQIYKDVLEGRKRIFPHGTWDNKQNGAEVTRYLIEEVLGWTREDVCQHLGTKTFKENKLKGMLAQCFGNSSYTALDYTYPGKYKPWELQSVPQDFWTEHTVKEAITWLIEEKLEWHPNDVRENLGTMTFKENNLEHMLRQFFKFSPHAALEAAYPGEYLPWEIKHTPKNYWNTDTGVTATRWLIEEKLQWSRQQVCDHLDKHEFIKAGLGGMIHHIFGNSPYAAIEAAYPGQYKPWELGKTPRGYWNDDTAKMAVRWLVEEKLGLSIDEARNVITRHHFKAHNLGHALKHYFGDSASSALNAVYGANSDS